MTTTTTTTTGPVFGERLFSRIFMLEWIQCLAVLYFFVDSLFLSYCPLFYWQSVYVCVCGRADSVPSSFGFPFCLSLPHAAVWLVLYVVLLTCTLSRTDKISFSVRFLLFVCSRCWPYMRGSNTHTHTQHENGAIGVFA